MEFAALNYLGPHPNHPPSKGKEAKGPEPYRKKNFA
jgi:hypothetical protein